MRPFALLPTPTITTTLPPQPQQVSTDSSVVITQATQEPQQLK